MVYKKLRVDVTEKQILQALKGKQIRITPGQINSGEQFLSLHPLNAKKVESAFIKKKGTTIYLSQGEIIETASNMQGKGFWSNIWKVVKKGWGALKDSGLLTMAADAAVGPVAAYTGQPALVGGARKLLKDTTGIGLTQEPKRRMLKADKYAMLKGSGIYLS